MNERDTKRWSETPGNRSSLPGELAQEILGAISSLQYGSVEITVHDSKVTQIERKEKIRPASQTAREIKLA